MTESFDVAGDGARVAIEDVSKGESYWHDVHICVERVRDEPSTKNTHAFHNRKYLSSSPFRFPQKEAASRQRMERK